MRFLLLALTICLASCGWQLRGSSPADLQLAELSGVYISGSLDNPVAESLRSQLRCQDVALLDQPAANGLALILEEARMQRRVQTVRGDLRARQMRLQMDISVSIYDYQAELVNSQSST